ncbi:hypothetical protein FQA47_016861 [Oryzias melastigma]|uniref:Uncharacterized protein n=1 Tax=Oryzias melastigma TaxID=30732 RepID=A0A834CDW0_ORYME|nr:hypothetical protein FQA47_016861 [Oryzias melastigma]
MRGVREARRARDTHTHTHSPPFTELATLGWSGLATPPTRRRQHPSSWARALRDPHHKSTAAARLRGARGVAKE